MTPYPWPEILGYLSRRITPGLESIHDGRYIRHTPAGDVTVTHEPGAPFPAASPDRARPAETLSRVRHLFGLDGDAEAVNCELGKHTLFRARVRRLPGLRIPGCWEPFELCLRVILGQQVTVAGASTLMGRLGNICPGYVPEDIARVDLRKLGVPGRRIRTIQSLARAVADGTLQFATQPWEETARELRRIPGIGPWTVSYLAIRLGRDPDAFPESDLGLLRSARAATPKELLRLADAWRPYRAYAAMHLWITPQLPDSSNGPAGRNVEI